MKFKVKHIIIIISILSLIIISICIFKLSHLKKENTYPILTLNGELITKINVGDEYTESGYSSYDKYDGDITNNVKVENNVDITMPGTYEITYTSINSTGNITKKTRYVKVKLSDKFTYKEKYNNIDNTIHGWGTNNKKDGTRPNTDISNDELKKYNAYAMGKDDKKIYLTFDEGSMNSYLPDIVEILDKNDVKATFFLCKSYIVNNHELIKKMANNGHSIGNHTMSHLSMPTLANKQNFQKYLNEIIATEKAYLEATGNEMDHIYREPRGEFSYRTLSIMKDLGYSTYFWSAAYKDWDDSLSKENAYNSMIERRHNGAIYLLHPTSRGNYLALDDFIKKMKNDGYTFDLVKNIN